MLNLGGHGTHEGYRFCQRGCDFAGRVFHGFGKRLFLSGCGPEADDDWQRGIAAAQPRRRRRLSRGAIGGSTEMTTISLSDAATRSTSSAVSDSAAVDSA